MFNLRNICPTNQVITLCLRGLSTSEVSTALRPFYFTVHPDLFGQYPSERQVNENSLKQLSAILENLQSQRKYKPVSLEFYIKDKGKEGIFRQVSIYLQSQDIRETILKVLKTCDLSTDYVDKIPEPPKPQYKRQTVSINTEGVDFSKVSENDPIFGQYVMRQKIKEAQDALKLRNWLKKNHESALKLLELHQPFREEVHKLKEQIEKQLELEELRWSTGWNETHFRGCLQSFMTLVQQNSEIMHILKGRTLVFAPFTGVSLDGHIMLNSGEVRHNWLDLLKNVQTHDAVLRRIPNFEKSVSQVLRNIKVGRRKFMFKIQAGEYESNLQRITTSLSDYRGYRGFPKSWPDSLREHEIVVENEAGPLMVSPTGQFIVPCSLPGSILVNFITANIKEAGEKALKYKTDKYKERDLLKQCIVELELESLFKDDSVTPELMIQCCERLLENKYSIVPFLKGIRLNIATYYSVLTDGVVCIPWNWKL